MIVRVDAPAPALDPLPIVGPPDPAEIDRNLYLDFLTRKVMRAWTERETTPSDVPWTPLSKPLDACTVACVSSAGIALRIDEPFDQEHERRDPWWGDPTYRVIPRGTRTSEVRIYHLHIDPAYGEQDMNCVMPIDRLAELEQQGIIAACAAHHYSCMGYLLRPREFLDRSVPEIIAKLHDEQVDVVLLVPV
jgi:D-proline reductase (dithiol) PrdB